MTAKSGFLKLHFIQSNEVDTSSKQAVIAAIMKEYLDLRSRAEALKTWDYKNDKDSNAILELIGAWIAALVHGNVVELEEPDISKVAALAYIVLMAIQHNTSPVAEVILKIGGLQKASLVLEDAIQDDDKPSNPASGFNNNRMIH